MTQARSSGKRGLHPGRIGVCSASLFSGLGPWAGPRRGADLQWKARPGMSLEGRCVLVVDDILDEGLTLAAVLEWCREQGAEQVLSAVLVHKDHDRKPALKRADFTGLTVPDRYVFGCGMDYQGRFRNLRGIYALKGH